MVASGSLIRSSHPETEFSRLFRSISRFIAALSMAAGVTILTGWAIDSEILRGATISGGIGVKTNTAIAFLLTGISLWLHNFHPARRTTARAAQVLAAIVLLIGAMTLSEHVTGRNLGIDQLIFQEPPGEQATTSPNRMGPPASFCFSLAGLALLLLNNAKPSKRDFVSTLAVAMGLVALLPFLGYLFGAKELYGIAKYTGIAFPTALMLLILSAGIILAFEGGRILTLLNADHAGGMLARRLLLPAVVLPPILGYLRTVGENAGFYEAPIGRSLLIIAFIVVFTSLVWWSARVLEKIDRSRRGAQEAQAQLGAIVESSDDAIISTTLDGVITSWNGGAERLFGRTSKESVGQSILFIVPPELHDEEPRVLARIRAAERVDHFETVRLAKDGRRIDVSISISPVKNDRGRIIGASKVVRDITKSKQMEAERVMLLEAERAARNEAERVNRMKDEFLATLSHELRTPLNAILGWSHVLRKGPASADDLTQGLDVIDRNARMQTQLIEDLLDMSRIISGKLRLDVQRISPSSFVEAAIETVKPAAEGKGVRLDVVLDPSAGPISGDPNRLQQVMWNLLSNAIKFTPRGGKVQIVLARVNSHIEITVADTGQGIAVDFSPFVFDRFRQADASTTRKAGGLGLGLAITKQLIELHGGTVRVKSAGEGQGATFILEIPLTAIQAEYSEPPRHHPKSATGNLSPQTQNAILRGISVLVVDDEADARSLIQRVLRDSQAEVTTAGSGDEALSLIEELKPNVLISDIGMPDMDGYEFLRRVRARTAPGDERIPAIALTAFARSEDRTRALLAGYHIHVAKPVEPSELLATVASLAGRTGQEE